MGACFFLKFFIWGGFFLRLPLVLIIIIIVVSTSLFLYYSCLLLYCVEFDYYSSVECHSGL